MSHTRNHPYDRSNTEKPGYTDYDRDIASLADDGYGAASRSRNIVHAGYTEYMPEIATMADDGCGAAPRD